MGSLIWILLILGIVVFAFMAIQGANSKQVDPALELDDAKADARQSIERLGGQVYMLSGSNPAATQALADAGERYTAAGAQIDQASSPAQARLAKQTALEGLYYVRAAREAMDMDPGPPVQGLDGQSGAGKVTEQRTVEFDGREITASPDPTDKTTNFFPGGRVAGRPVPAGWYSEQWWRPALMTGLWAAGSAVLFTSLFSGMAGVGYGADSFIHCQDASDQQLESGDSGDTGGDFGDGGDFGGGDFGGGDFGDFGGFGGFDI